VTADLRLLTGDREQITEITSWLDEKPTLARYAAAARRFDELHERRPELFTERSLLILRNFTIEPVEPFLRVAAYRAGVALTISYSGYDPGAGGELDGEGGSDQDVLLIALRLEQLAPAWSGDFLGLAPGAAAELASEAVEQVLSLARRLRARSRSPILVHNFVAPLAPAAGLGDAQDPAGQLNTVRRMNVELAERVRRLEGSYVLDADHLLSQLGLRHSIDARGSRVSEAPFSVPALNTLADAYVRHILALHGPLAKGVVVDCDNTLWGGVVGEDGISRLTLGATGAGRRHRDLQQQLLDLRRRGVVLAIVSKNEMDDVLEVLRTHPDCLLHEDDFAAMCISWEDKVESIASIARELNLGPEHLVFIDDNPVECEWVARCLPEVRVVQWPDDVGEGRTLDDLGLFDSVLITGEDRTRTDMYRAESKRHAARDGATTVEDYLRSLEMIATIGRTRPQHLPRVSQLTLRTNQFNLTTRRYDFAALEELLAQPDCEVLWLDLQDRFGDSGIVGCGILRCSGRAAVIDTLLVSCRVIGRGAEELLVHALAKLAHEMGAVELIGEYIPSKRNAQVSEFYRRVGFQGPEPQGATSVWRWDLSRGLPDYPDWLELTDPEGLLNER
jgi:FkbH-like protein